MNYLLVFIGGGLGSVVRFLISRIFSRVNPNDFPMATFLSNAIACFILALLVVFITPKTSEYNWVQPFLVIGFCGGFSTFSTFSFETLQLFQNGNYVIGLANILLSILVGIGLIWFISLKS